MEIYKITCNETNKVYIGKTERNVQERWKRHINDAESGRLDTHFVRAIRAYGAEAFSVETIDEASSTQELDEKEVYWINFYNSAENGYNSTEGGEGGNTYKYKTQEEMDIISAKIAESKLRGNNPHSRSVKCFNIETNEELFFSCMIECQMYFGEKNHQFCSRRCAEKINYMY